jgi:hypothetical protein
MEYVSPRELDMDVWSELAHKLPPEDAAPPDEHENRNLHSRRKTPVLWQYAPSAVGQSLEKVLPELLLVAGVRLRAHGLRPADGRSWHGDRLCDPRPAHR